jgi:hypothetical protein
MQPSAVWLCSAIVFLASAVPLLAQNPCSDFLGAVVKVQSGREIGAGVIVSADASRTIVATAAHVVPGTDSVNITFRGVTNRTFPASRLVVTSVSEDDLAILVVKPGGDVIRAVSPPYLVFRPSNDVTVGERVTTIGHTGDTDWKCVAQVNSVTALRLGSDPRFFASTRSGVGDGASGGPLFDQFGQLMGIVTRTAKDLGGDVVSTKIEGILATVRKAGVTPDRIVEKRGVPPDRTPPIDPTAIADRDAVDTARKFLDLLARNQMSQAYGMFSPTVTSTFSLAQFVTSFTQYAGGMAGRQLTRRLSTAVRGNTFTTPAGPVTAETYVLTFSTVDPGQPGPTVFEIVTIARQENRWGIVSFVWNTVNGDPAPAPTSQTSVPSDAEALARQILGMISRNELTTVYRRFVSDLQKRTSLPNEAAFVSVCTAAQSAFPGTPSNLTLIATRHYDTLPLFFGDYKSDFLMLVFIAQYPSGNAHQELYFVRESGEWKVAAYMVRPAL